MLLQMHLLNEPKVDIPEGETLRVVKHWWRNQDPFAFGRRPHRRIKGLRVGKRKVRIVSKSKGGRDAIKGH